MKFSKTLYSIQTIKGFICSHLSNILFIISNFVVESLIKRSLQCFLLGILVANLRVLDQQPIRVLDQQTLVFKGSLKDLKHRCPFDLQITVASKMKEPSEVTIKITVKTYLDFFHLWLSFLSPLNLSLVRLWKIIQACLNLICFMAHNTGTTCTVVVETSSTSPHNFFSLTPYIFSHFSSHPFVAVKSINFFFLVVFAISISSPWKRDPSGYMFVLVHFPYHLYKISLVTWYFPWRRFF